MNLTTPGGLKQDSEDKSSLSPLEHQYSASRFTHRILTMHFVGDIFIYFTLDKPVSFSNNVEVIHDFHQSLCVSDITERSELTSGPM